MYEATTGKNPKDAWYMINGGTGSVGRLAIASLIAEGIPPEHIIATGTTQEKLDFLQASYPGLRIFNLKEADQAQSTYARIEDQIREFGGKIPIVIEATGHDPSPILPFIGKGTVFVAVGLSGNVRQGPNLVDNNNFVVRHQRTILVRDDNDDGLLLAAAQKIYANTVADNKPDILMINSPDDIAELQNGDRKFDIVLDKAGSAAADINPHLRKGGILITSPLEGNSPLPTRTLMEKGVVLVGSWGRDEEDWGVMNRQAQQGRLHIETLPINLFPFSETGLQRALENAQTGKVGFDMR